jgi:prepilin-type N-terminal cleavage/methylation domain-containing protein
MRGRGYRKKYGVTLIELIIVIVVSAILFLGISIPLQAVLVRGIAPEYQMVASMLAERELERIVGLRFSTVNDMGGIFISFSPPYENYSYSLDVDFVDGPNNLDSEVALSDYKRVRVIIRHPSIDDIIVSTLLTENDF